MPAGIFLHYLENLSALVNRVRDCDTDDGVFLRARLAPEMFPLAQQITTAVGFSLRALCPLAEMETPELGGAGDYVELQNLILRARDFIGRIPAEAFDGFELRAVTTRAGFADCHFSGADYLNLYALPNFLFHYSMAYAILRAEGVPIGKRDFDGFHDYPAGFSFPGQ